MSALASQLRGRPACPLLVAPPLSRLAPSPPRPSPRSVGCGTSPAAAGANGFPPLVYLARGDKGEHPEKIALLLEHGADVNARGGPHGRTALHYAAAAEHVAVVRQLLAAGADPALADDEGRTPRAVARAAGHRLRGL